MERLNQWLEAKWPSPYPIKALTTKRLVLVEDKLRDFNLALHATNSPDRVKENREILEKILDLKKPITWLDQKHGSDVVQLPHPGIPQADACFTSEPFEVCAILTADCLPILLCDKECKVVAAIHAGWRSISQNIIQKTIEQIQTVTHNDLMAWLGPAIGPSHYEVGEEIKEAFVALEPSLTGCFVPSPNQADHLLLDLYQSARLLLKQSGVKGIYGGGHCTYTESTDYYSHRRDPDSGRMATLIWKSV